VLSAKTKTPTSKTILEAGRSTGAIFLYIINKKSFQLINLFIALLTNFGGAKTMGLVK